MINKLKEINEHYNELGDKLSDPNIISDQSAYTKLMREHKHLTPIIDKFNEYLEYELGGKVKVARVLGGTKSMQSFYEYCVGKGATFYPELNITTNKGYDYLFGSTRFTSRGVGNEESIHYVYDLATGRPNKKLKENSFSFILQKCN